MQENTSEWQSKLKGEMPTRIQLDYTLSDNTVIFFHVAASSMLVF